MSNVRRFMFSTALLLTVVSLANAQRGAGRIGMVSAVDLASAESIQTEIEINDDQKQAVEELRQGWRTSMREVFQSRNDGSVEEMREKMQTLTTETDGKLREVLEEAQAKRLGEIFVQVNGVQSVSHSLVAKALSISDEQKEEIRQINRETFAAMRAAFDGGGSREEMREKMGKFREEMAEKMLGKLSDEQKEKLESLKGAAFEFDRSQLRRRNRS